MSILRREREHLRNLAARQRDIAASEEMTILRRRHWDLNTSTMGTRPTIRLESRNYASEFIPGDAVVCETPLAQRIEAELLYRLHHHRVIHDDMIIPANYPIQWKVDVDEFGIVIERTTGDRTATFGYAVEYPIKVIREDFEKLKPLVCKVDRQHTEEYRNRVEETIGDILPVEMIGYPTGIWPGGVTFLTRGIIGLMGMENFYLAMTDEPQNVHRLMEYLLENAARLMQYYEREGIMYVNNGAQELGQASYSFSDRLPAPGFTGTPRLRDMFLRTDSQETTGISPEMFREFCLPYYRRLCAMGGLWYYGCCEPVQAIWRDCLDTIPNIKKLSISPWCDESVMGSILSDSGILYSRKLDATFLGVSKELDEERLARSIRQTMKHAKGCQIEFISRDVYTILGNAAKLKRAVDIIRREIADALDG
jgi:hypothetical protein